MKDEIRRKVERKPLYEHEPKTLAELFRHAKQNHPRKNALNFKREEKWRAISSDEMLLAIESIAAGLNSIGLKPGDRAAILASNSPNWTFADAGCQFAGVVDVPIYTTLVPDSIKYILNDSGAKVLFIEDVETFKRIEEIIPHCANLEKLIFFGEETIDSDDAITLSDLTALGKKLLAGKPDLIEGLMVGVNPDDVATLIYTSGTTGEPKGVMLSHENIISNVIDSCEHFSFIKDDVPLSVLPLSHVFERTGMYLYIFNGMAVHYAESIEKVPQNLQEVRMFLQ